MRYLSLVIVAASALLTACTQRPPAASVPVVAHPGAPAIATPSPVPESPEAVPVEPATARPPQPVRKLADGSQLPAVKGLVASADSALARGEVELASVNLERAQRLAPQSAVVYQKLAKVRLKQSRPAEAEQMARKALAFASGSAQQAELWRLIASARRQRGQQSAAQEAEAKALALETATAADVR